jgi:hypothetical protein
MDLGIWFNSGHKVVQMDCSGEIIATYPPAPSNPGCEASAFFAEDPSGHIWASGWFLCSLSDPVSGLFRMQEGQWIQFMPPNGSAGGDSPIYISPDRELLCAGASGPAKDWNRGIWTYKEADWRFYDWPFQEPYYARTVAIDNNGSIWIPAVGPFGTEGGGVAVCWRHRLDDAHVKVDVHISGHGATTAQFCAGDSMSLTMDLTTDLSAVCDGYIGLQLPSNEMLLFYPSFGTAMMPFMSGITIPADTHLEDYELFTLTLPDLPAGTYTWYAACTYAGTMEFASNIASCDWQFVK